MVMNMELAAPAPSSNWLTLLRDHARNHPFAALGLGVATLATLALLVQSVVWVLTGEEAINPRYALLGGTAAVAALAPFGVAAPAAVGVGVIYGLYGLAPGALGALAFGLPRRAPTA